MQDSRTVIGTATFVVLPRGAQSLCLRDGPNFDTEHVPAFLWVLPGDARHCIGTTVHIPLPTGRLPIDVHQGTCPKWRAIDNVLRSSHTHPEAGDCVEMPHVRTDHAPPHNETTLRELWRKKHFCTELRDGTDVRLKVDGLESHGPAVFLVPRRVWRGTTGSAAEGRFVRAEKTTRETLGIQIPAGCTRIDLGQPAFNARRCFRISSTFATRQEAGPDQISTEVAVFGATKCRGDAAMQRESDNTAAAAVSWRVPTEACSGSCKTPGPPILTVINPRSRR